MLDLTLQALATSKYGTGGPVTVSGFVFLISAHYNVDDDFTQRSHYASETSFTLLDDAHIVTAGPERGELVVEAFVQGIRGEGTGPVLALGLPPQRESVRIQESSIPFPRSPTEPFWTDPALRMVVVKLTDESALLIPFKTFLSQISAAQIRKQATPERVEPPQLTWEDWRAHTFPLVAPETKYPMWSFKHCHSYGSRIVVNGYKHLAVMFDLNPWAARNARRFPEPSRRSDGSKTPKDLFNTRDVTLPHGVVLDEWYRGMGLGQSTPGLATDPMGFTEVVSAHTRSCGFRKLTFGHLRSTR